MYFQGTSRRQPVSQYRQTSKVFCHFQFSILFLVEYRSLVQTIGRILWSRVSINFQLIWKFCETVHEVFMTNLPKSGFSPVETLFLHNWLMRMIVSALLSGQQLLHLVEVLHILFVYNLVVQFVFWSPTFCSIPADSQRITCIWDGHFGSMQFPSFLSDADFLLMDWCPLI